MTSKVETCDNNTSNKSKKRSPPDGGFGWFIVIAYGTANVSGSFVILSEGLLMIERTDFTRLTDKKFTISLAAFSPCLKLSNSLIAL